MKSNLFDDTQRRYVLCERHHQNCSNMQYQTQHIFCPHQILHSSVLHVMIHCDDANKGPLDIKDQIVGL